MSQRNKIEFELKEVKYHIWRLHDEEQRSLSQSSLPIKDDSSFTLNFLILRKDKNNFNLAKKFLILEHILGESSYFDNSKGSFYFPLLVSIEKEARPFFYLLNIYDLSGCTYYNFYKIVEDGIENYDIDVVREPFDSEFSHEEMNYFISYFEGYLIGRFQSAEITPDKPFMKKICSSLILYGYQDGEYFEQDYESEEDFQNAIKSFEDKYGASQKKIKSDITTLLNQITLEE